SYELVTSGQNRSRPVVASKAISYDQLKSCDSFSAQYLIMKLCTCNARLWIFQLLAGLFVLQNVNGQTFQYNFGDTMLCFRKAQRNGGTKGIYNFEVNLGPYSQFINAAPGAK